MFYLLTLAFIGKPEILFQDDVILAFIAESSGKLFAKGHLCICRSSLCGNAIQFGSLGQYILAIPVTSKRNENFFWNEPVCAETSYYRQNAQRSRQLIEGKNAKGLCGTTLPFRDMKKFVESEYRDIDIILFR